MGQHVRAGDLDIWTEQVGEGPDVLLIGGAGDTVESWQFQLDGLADRYRMTAFDNRGAGRTAMPDGPVTAAVLADDAAAVLDSLGIASAHVAGFSGGSDSAARPELGRVVAEAIPGAVFEVLEGEAHQPFQEIPDTWNARVDAFWQEVEARDRGRPPSRETADRVSSGRSG
jgi:pimeloyl-ACP methyl ester carboxylesterase